jgi:hypothetical protein
MIKRMLTTVWERPCFVFWMAEVMDNLESQDKDLENIIELLET